MPKFQAVVSGEYEDNAFTYMGIIDKRSEEQKIKDAIDQALDNGYIIANVESVIICEVID